MPSSPIAFQVRHVPIRAADGSGSRDRAIGILREQRVLAAVRDAGSSRSDDHVVLQIPVTDAGTVLAAGEDGSVRVDLTADRLRELFDEQGLTLWLDRPDSVLEELDRELDDAYTRAFEDLVDADGLDADEWDEITADGDGPALRSEPVRVAEFSHRGPWGARVTAQLLAADVDYLEDGVWSLYRYRTDRVHPPITEGGEDGIVTLNLPTTGDAWVEVTTPRGGQAVLWPNAQCDTRPVLDLEMLDELGGAASALYRRILVEGDGVRDEIQALALGGDVDLEAVVRACMPEAVGGPAGEDERLQAVLAAFGVPGRLADIALPRVSESADAAAGAPQVVGHPGPGVSRMAGRGRMDPRVVGHGTGAEGAGDSALGVRTFRPRGWTAAIGAMLLGGMAETTPLTRRDRPLARLTAALRRRPALGMLISGAELAAGAALTGSRSRLLRGLGVFIVIDAAADLVIWAVRIRRR